MKLRRGMFVVHTRTGYLGMIVKMLRSGRVSMQDIQNGPRTRAALSMLRPASLDEIKEAGLSGVGCVEPPVRDC